MKSGEVQIVDEAKESYKVDQNDNNAESSQEIDDVRNSSLGHDFQVEDTKALEKKMINNICSDETEDDIDECDKKPDDLASCGLIVAHCVQNNVQSKVSSAIKLGTHIDFKEYKESQETVEKEDNNLQQSQEQTVEVRIKTGTTQQEHEDARKDSMPSITVEEAPNKEEIEQERIKLAVERAIREVRECAFAEVKQRAKALAEKEKCDLLALKEQVERNKTLMLISKGGQAGKKGTCMRSFQPYNMYAKAS
ncbi:hypothetical protein QVD17_10509 [Tagetes erecta]|uniref:Uncharacterized protein n=1 Tax=Tagetes erecta TaxID=13708 RepID=A0AAD8L2K2_TARER|nr:hypothetical protein QVD17_10509 [Tagetes erecta]